MLWLPQALTLAPEATVRDVVLGTAWLAEGMGAEHEWAGDAGVRAILDGLGMPHLGLDQPVGPMSGGERRRVALAALLVRESDLLILDEPTNHLDVGGVDWLARHLVGRRGALVVVTHDRWFLDAVCTTTWEVADQTVRAYEGGFAAWTLARAERERVAAATEARRQNLLRKEIAWLRRGPPARTSKPKFRIDAANALIADVPPPRDTMSLQRMATARLGKQVYDLEHVDLHAGPKAILHDITWQVGPGDRIAILGRQRRRQDHPAAAAGRHHPRRRRPARHRLHRAAGVPLPGTRRTARPPAGARGRRGGRPPGAARRPGALRRPARRGVRFRRPAALDPGR